MISTTLNLSEPPELKDHYNPLNGNPITKTKFEELQNKKVFAVTINNHTKARPQSGLSIL